MAKTVSVTLRLEPAIKTALAKAASDDQRTVSSLIEKIVVDWLRKHRYVKERK